MRNEAFEAFLAKVQNDESLRNELRAAGGETGMPVEALVAFAASKGHEIKVADITGELTDQQLEAVAGGRLAVKKGNPVPRGALDDSAPAAPMPLFGSTGEKLGKAGSTILSALAQQTPTDSAS